MSTRLTKAKLLENRLGATKEVELAGLGTVLIRGLTRADVIESREIAKDEHGKVDPAVSDDHMLSRAMVDPELTPEEVAVWGTNAPAGELSRVLDAVQEMSALKEHSFRPNVPGNRQQRRARK